MQLLQSEEKESKKEKTNYFQLSQVYYDIKSV